MNIINWVLWVIANIFGSAIGGTVGFTCATYFGNYESLIYTSVLSAVWGVSIGLAQQLVLLRWFKINLWIVLTTLGWFIGLLTDSFAFEVIRNFLFNFSQHIIVVLIAFYISAFALGGLIGLFQWLIIKNWVRGAHQWILINIWSVGVSFFIAYFGLDFPIDSQANLIFKIFLLSLFGLINGAITGERLLKLLQRPKFSRRT